jgi:hypothetical protein
MVIEDLGDSSRSFLIVQDTASDQEYVIDIPPNDHHFGITTGDLVHVRVKPGRPAEPEKRRRARHEIVHVNSVKKSKNVRLECHC